MSTAKRYVPAIVDQHSDEAAFLWLLRDRSVIAPHYSLKDLSELDNRIEANLDGLRIAGNDGWETCQRDLNIGEPGEVFAASVLAFESGDGKKIDSVISVGKSSAENYRALVSAFGWIEFANIENLIFHLITANAEEYRHLGIAACAVHRKDPGQLLTQALHSNNASFVSRAIKAAGELKRLDLLPAVAQFFQTEDTACRFWSAWSATLMGDRLQSVEFLKHLAVSNSPYREIALQVLMRTIGLNQAQSWLKSQAKNQDWFRYLVIGTGITGNPMYIPWLIKQMEKPLFARVAGEAFSMITGIDLAYEDLEGEWPEGFEAGPTDDPEDEDVEMDEDEDLPWPKPKLISKWWGKHQGGFQQGVRYLVGAPISEEHCRNLLVTGMQRQRNAAALELALMNPNEPLFETRAPGFRQRRLLGA